MSDKTGRSASYQTYFQDVSPIPNSLQRQTRHTRRQNRIRKRVQYQYNRIRDFRQFGQLGIKQHYGYRKRKPLSQRHFINLEIPTLLRVNTAIYDYMISEWSAINYAQRGKV